MSLKKVGKFVNDRLVLFVGVGLIISIHWGWYKLQQVPYLVSESERKEFPLIRATKFFHKKIMSSLGSHAESSPVQETARKSE